MRKMVKKYFLISLESPKKELNKVLRAEHDSITINYRLPNRKPLILIEEPEHGSFSIVPKKFKELDNLPKRTNFVF